MAYLGIWLEWFELIIAIAVLRRAIASVTNADVIGTLVIGGAICAAVGIGNGVQQNPWASIVTALRWTTKKKNLQRNKKTKWRSMKMLRSNG